MKSKVFPNLPVNPHFSVLKPHFWMVSVVESVSRCVRTGTFSPVQRARKFSAVLGTESWHRGSEQHQQFHDQTGVGNCPILGILDITL